MITFPRDLPEINGKTPFSKCSFNPSYDQLTNPARRGKIQVVNVGVDLWVMEYRTKPLTREQAELFKAWLHSLRGGARTFKAWDARRRRPEAYRAGWDGINRAGGGAFDGTANVDAIGMTRDTVTIDNLPSGFELRIGDMMSFPIGGTSQSLHRVMEGVSANVGGILTATIEPIVPLAAVADVTCTFEKPWCLAVLDPTSISTPDENEPGPVSFNAVQTF